MPFPAAPLKEAHGLPLSKMHASCRAGHAVDKPLKPNQALCRCRDEPKRNMRNTRLAKARTAHRSSRRQTATKNPSVPSVSGASVLLLTRANPSKSTPFATSSFSVGSSEQVA